MCLKGVYKRGMGVYLCVKWDVFMGKMGCIHWSNGVYTWVKWDVGIYG